MQTAEGRRTACLNEQLAAVLEEWSPIFERFRTGEPSTAEFDAAFGPYLSHAPMTAERLTGPMLVDALTRMRPSVPGLDQWATSDLQALARWHPALFESLAELFNAVEASGVWPAPLAEGFVAMLPKDPEDPEPTATAMRRKCRCRPF